MDSRIRMSFNLLSSSELMTLGLNIERQMTVNSEKFSKEIMLEKEALKAKTLEYQKILLKSNTKAIIEVAHFKEYKPRYIQFLRAFAVKLNWLYAGNDRMLDCTGYDILRAQADLSVTPVSQTILSQSKKNPKALKVSIKGGRHSISIVIWYTTNKDLPEGEWNKKTITRRSGGA